MIIQYDHKRFNLKVNNVEGEHQAILLSASIAKHSKAPAAQSAEQTRNGMFHP
jgi:hypothetical protein